ncbi:MAG: ATP-binding protein [Caulobacter sp.]|nr:ATP-binding protein [Caulobacter sp.]
MRIRALRIFIPRQIKRWLPTSLFGRSLLIIVLPIALMQLVVTWIFFDAHWQTVTSRLSDGLAGDIAWAVESYQDDPRPEVLTRIAERAEKSMSLSIVLLDDKQLPRRQPSSIFTALDRALDKSLSEKLDVPYWYDTIRFPAYVDIRVEAPGGVLRIIAPRDRAYATQGHIFIFWMALATLFLTAIAILFIRNQVRAIERLADAAETFGKGGDVDDFKPHGAKEVRQAAQAFIAMKNRIQRHIDQRTAMLASVSHDLRTPLTRLKLELALAEPSKRIEAMKSDLSEMEHMIDEYLAFARGEGGEAVEPVTLWKLVHAVGADAARAGARVEIEADPHLQLPLRPNAMRRALSNLVMNAAAHADRIAITVVATTAGGVEIIVDDNGPGIPPEHFEEAFKPFNRLDESRNQNEKGVGLGLAIARDVARGHGGDLTLDRAPLGGLRAVFRLPG